MLGSHTIEKAEMATQSKFSLFLIRYERLIPPLLFLIFLLLTVPGISWGAPDIWNPDELVARADLALGGELKFDETEPDFNYPSLPKYVMYGVGKLVYGLGYSRTEFLISARLVSVILGGLTVILIYLLARAMGGSIYTGLLAAFLTIFNSEFAHNARFAHNDLYLVFFITLAIYSLIKYRLASKKLWLYAAFFEIGLAASSKYNGVVLIVVPVIFFLFTVWREKGKGFLGILETLFIGLILGFLGYAAGTPKSLSWMSFYLKRATPAIFRHAVYGVQPDSVVGLFGQWGTFEHALGAPVYYLSLIALAWFCVKLVLYYLRRVKANDEAMDTILILLMAILVFDLPILFSYNYQPRFFLPFVPFFSILAGLFVDDLVNLATKRGYSFVPPVVGVSAFLIISFSLLRVISVMLLYVNDARSPASEFVKTLPAGTSIEYTLYPPTIQEGHFSRKHNYPIFFKKYPDQAVPTKKAYNYNEGEAGLEARGTDYLVIDSFTYARFSDDYICQSNPVECDFFAKLQAGETNYRLVKDFKYSLPAFLPELSIAAVNPEIKVYERVR